MKRVSTIIGLLITISVFSQNPFQSSKKTFENPSRSFILNLCPFEINDIIVFDTNCIEIDAEQVGSECDPLLGINVYLNDELYAFLNFGNTICDLPEGFYDIYITGVYNEGESEPSNTFEFWIFEIPLNPWDMWAQVFLTDNFIVYAFWDYYDFATQWYSHYFNYYGNGVGLTDGGSFEVAAVWDDQIYENSNYFIVDKFTFQTYDSGIFIPKIWTGESGEILLYTGDSLELNGDETITIEIEDEITIQASEKAWIGLEVIHEPGLYPMATDDGPAVIGFGDMLKEQEGTWQSLSQYYGLDYNWMIEAQLSPCIGNNNCSSFKGFDLYANDSIDPNPNYVKRNSGLIQEHFYEDWLDWTTNPFDLYYFVSAKFQNGSSFSSDTVLVVVTGNINNQTERNFIIFPNPASDKIEVRTSEPFKEIQILDLKGIIQKEVIPSDGFSFEIDINTLSPGIYLVKIESDAGRYIKKLIVK